jgi:hypothetical protein
MTPAELEPPRADYDDLSPEDQAVVRAEWASAIDGRLDGLDLVQEFAAQGRSYVELDEDDHVVTRLPGARR